MADKCREVKNTLVVVVVFLLTIYGLSSYKLQTYRPYILKGHVFL